MAVGSLRERCTVRHRRGHPRRGSTPRTPPSPCPASRYRRHDRVLPLDGDRRDDVQAPSRNLSDCDVRRSEPRSALCHVDCARSRRRQPGGAGRTFLVVELTGRLSNPQLFDEINTVSHVSPDNERIQDAGLSVVAPRYSTKTVRPSTSYTNRLKQLELGAGGTIKGGRAAGPTRSWANTCRAPSPTTSSIT
jgi:hypothetical protein